MTSTGHSINGVVSRHRPWWWHLAAELRSGDIAVVGSDSYANLHAQLMTWQECQPLVAQFCAQAGIPTDAEKLVAFYRDKLIKPAVSVNAGYPANTDLVLDGDKPVLKRRKGNERRPSALALEAAIHERLPERSLLDLLGRYAARVGGRRLVRSVGLRSAMPRG
jgi:hypothetical protein